MSERKQVVFTLDEDNKPDRMLAVADNDDYDDVMSKWWLAFANDKKQKPDGYNGIGHQPVADFERWKEPNDE